MKVLPFLLCLFLTGCGYNPAIMQPRLAAMSDAQLIRHHHFLNAGWNATINRQQGEWALAEMKRRGLIGPGRDGIQAKEGDR
jgi:hypothetical protein